MALVCDFDVGVSNVNNVLQGPFLATLHFLPLLKKCELGKVLNISSDLASIASMFPPRTRGTDGSWLMRYRYGWRASKLSNG